MEKIVEERLDKRAIGFDSEVKSKNVREISELLKEVTPQDLVKFGLIPEFIGRVPINVSLDGLDKDALIRILKEPKNALVKQYAKLFEYDDVKLTFDDDALDAIAEKAVKHKTGARGLRSIVENIMMDVMYEIPSDDSIVSCRITNASVDGTEKPVVERK